MAQSCNRSCDLAEKKLCKCVELKKCFNALERLNMRCAVWIE